MNQLSHQSQKFKALLSEIDDEVAILKQQIKDLKKENSKLVTKLEDLRGKQTDIFSAITESERLAMRQHVKGLISKIDNHLSDQA
jgi:predicted  nucleic acid-binding Zn-ribbon protein